MLRLARVRPLALLLVAAAAVSAAAAAVLFVSGRIGQAGLPVVGALAAGALTGLADKRFASSSFTFWVLAFLAAAMYYPRLFTSWGFDANRLVIPLLQLVMFGMGTKLRAGEFAEELKRPKALAVAALLVFTVMPAAGLAVARLFHFPADIAAGVILTGCCPGGAASNVMAFLARGNVALSVSATTLCTLLTPAVTPLLMKLLAGALVEVSFLKMAASSLNLILAPMGAGLVCHKILYGTGLWLKRPLPVIALGCACLAAAAAFAPIPMGGELSVVKPGLILGLALVGIVSVAKASVDAAGGPADWMERLVPKLSMVSILLYVTIVVALNRDELLQVGLLLVAASAAHNLAGFAAGYWVSRGLGLAERDCRTVSIEVGLKNGGLGMGLALEALASPNAALAPIVFGKWMNISGSALANYWRNRPAGAAQNAVVG